MTENVVQMQPRGAILPLTNLGIAERAVARVNNRGPLDPGLVVMNGPSGWGKSVAAAWIKSRHRAYYVQADDFWTKKTMLIAISRAIGLGMVKGNMFDLANAIKEQLEKSQRILIIDEFDFIVDKNLVESVRSLYEGSKAAILIIGEEGLPQKLKQWERFHGRILDWFPAEPASIADARELARAKCPGVAIDDDLLARLIDLSRGSVRRISNNLGRIFDEAADQGWEHVNLKLWGARGLQTGEPPRRGV